ncbi:LysR family transcriptional regulator [Pseudoduganella albidiflava]|uniref:LysR family transcriptional regulator n=2 Tax=Pseudoduganella albidiflava TaxID=321983 RepID=A0A411X8D6_9BURK|nr:LysR family transcriptional regulator [Pseudoduganella albidiflava]GGY42964.1 LysR family transcriptional regulator [Pseudoduganella albidiflava]
MNDLHNSDLDLNLLPVFDALIRVGNVSRAAEDLSMSQSAVSHALKRLRLFFGDPLFLKTGAGMQPTPRALELRGPVLSVMGTVRGELLVREGFDAARSNRVFSLLLTDMGELIFLPRLIARLRETAPHCTLRTLQVPMRQVQGVLESGEGDLALGSLHAVPDGLFQQQLFTRSFVTIVNRRNSDIGETLSRDQFFAMEHIVVSLSGKLEDAYDAIVDELDGPRRIYLMTPHFLTVPMIIEENPQLIATVPRELATKFAGYKSIRMVATPVPVPPFAIRQHWHPRVHHDAANIWLRQQVKQTFDTAPE